MSGIIKKPFLFSLCAGLFLALNFYMLFIYYLSPEFEWVSFEYQLKSYIENAFLFFTIGFVVSAFFAICIGWPLYLIAKKYSAINYITCSLGGISVTVLPYATCVFFGWNIPNVTTKPGLTLFLVIVFCGAVSGLIFNQTSAAIRGRHHNRFTNENDELNKP